MEYLLALGQAVVENAPNLIGFILPPFVQILNRDVPSKSGKYAVSIMVCIVLSVLLHWGEIANGTPDKAVIYATIIFAESKTLYDFYFKESWIKEKIDSRIGAYDVNPSVAI